jgi:hypothetical protein
MSKGREPLDETELYAKAGAIVWTAMGREHIKRGRRYEAVRVADEDPLAAWLAAEAIVELVKRGWSGR